MWTRFLRYTLHFRSRILTRELIIWWWGNFWFHKIFLIIIIRNWYTLKFNCSRHLSRIMYATMMIIFLIIWSSLNKYYSATNKYFYSCTTLQHMSSFQQGGEAAQRLVEVLQDAGGGERFYCYHHWYLCSIFFEKKNALWKVQFNNCININSFIWLKTS